MARKPKAKPPIAEKDPVSILLENNKQTQDDVFAVKGIPGEERKNRRPILFRHDPDSGHKIYFTNPRSQEPLVAPTPVAVRVTPSGGVIDGKSSYVIEIFYEGSVDSFGAKFYRSFENRVLVLEVGVNDKGKPIGKRYANLVCTFTGMALIPEIDEQRRFAKFACTCDVPLTDLDPVVTSPSYFKTAQELARFDARIKGIDFDRILKK
jgi:hypothetical protein